MKGSCEYTILRTIVTLALTKTRFTVYPRARREMTDYKVKSVLRGTEHECMFVTSFEFPILLCSMSLSVASRPCSVALGSHCRTKEN
jgi:hypothetical protein